MQRERASSAAAEQVLETLVQEILRLNPEAKAVEIDPDVGLLDAGYVDSLAAAQLLVSVEKNYGVFVSVDRLAGDLPTLRALAAWVAARAR